MGARRLHRLMAAGIAVSLSLGSAMAAQAAWEQARDGRWWYGYDHGNYATGWSDIAGCWYHFDANGWMETGWYEEDNRWYYLDPQSGAMARDCWVDGYYIGPDGVMAGDIDSQEKDETVISKTNVIDLLKAAFAREGIYQDALLKINSETGSEIIVDVGEEVNPQQYKIYNRYVVNKNTGAARSEFGSVTVYLK